MEIIVGETSVTIDTKASSIDSINMEMKEFEPSSIILEIIVIPLNYISVSILYNTF